MTRACARLCHDHHVVARCPTLHGVRCRFDVVCYMLHAVMSRVARCVLRVACCCPLAHGEARQREMRRSRSVDARLLVRAKKASRVLAHRYRQLLHIAQGSRRCNSNVSLAPPVAAPLHARTRALARNLFCLKPIRRPRQHPLRRHARRRARRVCPTPQNLVHRDAFTRISANAARARS